MGTVTVYNYGGAAAALTERMNGTDAVDFAVTGVTCTTLIGGMLTGGGASCTYTTKFRPSIGGAESATFSVSDPGDAASPHSVALTGIGS